MQEPKLLKEQTFSSWCSVAKSNQLAANSSSYFFYFTECHFYLNSFPMDKITLRVLPVQTWATYSPIQYLKPRTNIDAAQIQTCGSNRFFVAHVTYAASATRHSQTFHPAAGWLTDWELSLSPYSGDKSCRWMESKEKFGASAGSGCIWESEKYRHTPAAAAA